MKNICIRDVLLKSVDFYVWRENDVYLRCWYYSQPPARRPLAYAEVNESEEEKQFRKVFQQLAGEVSIRQTNIHIYTNTDIKHWLS